MQDIIRSIRFSPRTILIAYVVLLGIVFVRMPFRKIPDALFVSDGFGYYVYLPSLVIDHDLDLSNQFTRIPYEGQKAYFGTSPVTRKRTNQFTIGCAILWSPFFIFAHALVNLLSQLGFHVSKNGFGFLYELPVYLGSFTYGFVGLWVIKKTLCQLFSKEITQVCLYALVFTTPLLYYLISWFGIISLITFSPQFLIWKILYGKFFLNLRDFKYSGYDQIQGFWSPDMVPYLLQFYLFAPLLLLATVGLLLRPKGITQSAKNLDIISDYFLKLITPYFLILLIWLIFLYGHASTWAGGSYGQRRMIDWFPLFVIGLGMFMKKYPSLLEWNWFIPLLMLITICNVVAIALFILGYIPPILFA